MYNTISDEAIEAAQARPTRITRLCRTRWPESSACLQAVEGDEYCQADQTPDKMTRRLFLRMLFLRTEQRLLAEIREKAQPGLCGLCGGSSAQTQQADPSRHGG